MKHVVLKDEQVKISFDDSVSKNYSISLRGAIVKCLKHVYRYKQFIMPKDIMVSILLKALKGESCKKDHLDISQRLSLYEYLKDKDIVDPYIQQFIKETGERMK